MTENAGSTGRIGRRLTPAARRILFDRELGDQIAAELPIICQIDRAHVLMLAECGILASHPAKALLSAIQRLVDEQFAGVKKSSSNRGLFLLYEEYLIESEGPSVGGMLQIGRSRNDLGATLFRLRLRNPYERLLSAALRLQAVVLRRGQSYIDTIMPAYTHGQPAEAITYGHYLAGIGQALDRAIEDLLDSAKEIDTCPLGAAAVAGTAVPINAERTAALLGFTCCCPNSVDAVASRDLALRVLAAMVIYATTLSRMATDLLQWLTEEFGFLTLPDELVGSSSAMPQKRNPFLLEHVQGRTASVLGAFVSSVSATRSAPFTNSISVGTESVRPLWGAIQDVTDACNLLRLGVSKASPVAERMLERASKSFTNATAIASRMTLERGVDFRSAHRRVGGAVTEAISKGMSSLEQLANEIAGLSELPLDDMVPASCVSRSRYGGGPAAENIKAALAQLSEKWSRQRRVIRDRTNHWKAANDSLDATVRAFVNGDRESIAMEWPAGSVT